MNEELFFEFIKEWLTPKEFPFPTDLYYHIGYEMLTYIRKDPPCKDGCPNTTRGYYQTSNTEFIDHSEYIFHYIFDCVYMSTQCLRPDIFDNGSIYTNMRELFRTCEKSMEYKRLAELITTNNIRPEKTTKSAAKTR